MENNNPGKENNLSAKAQETIKKITDEEALQAQWRSEMMASETVCKYFEQYDEASVKSFLDAYLSEKNVWIQYGDMCIRMKEEEELRFDNIAQEYLEIIQQKKLFELQCLWRAEKIQIPSILFTYDFLKWEDDILNCPLIEPVTEDDIELCKQFLLEGHLDVNEDWFSVEWQFYEDMKDGYESNGEEGWYPAWYEFVDNRRGMSNIILPNIRGEKENFYRNLYFDNRREKDKAEAAVQKDEMEKRKPTLFAYDNKATAYLLQSFESRQVQHQYRAYKLSSDDSWDRENIDDMIRLLRSADEPIPIEANQDWLAGLQQTAFKYKCKKIAEALPRVWEQYNINIQMGIAFPNEKEYYDEPYNIVYKQILAGRKLNGEPEDFNF